MQVDDGGWGHWKAGTSGWEAIDSRRIFGGRMAKLSEFFHFVCQKITNHQLFFLNRIQDWWVDVDGLGRRREEDDRINEGIEDMAEGEDRGG